MRLICDDLEAEHESLDALVAGLEPARWDTPTPAEGWTVRDQIAHLAYSDVSARLAVVDAEAWEREFKIDRAERERRQHDVGWSRTPAELLAWWRECRRAMLAVFRPLDRRARIPWFGPPMSALTFATAKKPGATVRTSPTPWASVARTSTASATSPTSASSLAPTAS